MFWNWVKDQVEKDKLFFTIKNKQTNSNKKTQQNKQTHKPKQTKIKTITFQT